LKFAESLQMKLNKDLFPTNMNMIELKGKKVLVQPSQAEMTKGKEAITGEERPSRMIKPKSPKMASAKRMRGASPHTAQRSPSTSSLPSTKKVGLALGGVKTGPSGIPNRRV
jgi:hypothetical protein